MSDQFTNQHGYHSKYDENRKFGQVEGIGERLREHMRILGTDKTLPWVGLGLIDDLRIAAELLGTKSGHLMGEARAEVFSELALRRAANPAPMKSAPAKMEFDL